MPIPISQFFSFCFCYQSTVSDRRRCFARRDVENLEVINAVKHPLSGAVNLRKYDPEDTLEKSDQLDFTSLPK